MKNILISCISKFDRNKLDQGAYTYQNHDLTITAFQTNEACLKYLLSRLGAENQLDVHIRVQSNDVAAPGDFTMEYLNGEISRFCGENEFTVPQYFDVFIGEDEQYHRFDRVLSEISKEIQRIAADDPDITMYDLNKQNVEIAVLLRLFDTRILRQRRFRDKNRHYCEYGPLISAYGSAGRSERFRTAWLRYCAESGVQQG